MEYLRLLTIFTNRSVLNRSSGYATGNTLLLLLILTIY